MTLECVQIISVNLNDCIAFDFVPKSCSSFVACLCIDRLLANVRFGANGHLFYWCIGK